VQKRTAALLENKAGAGWLLFLHGPEGFLQDPALSEKVPAVYEDRIPHRVSVCSETVSKEKGAGSGSPFFFYGVIRPVSVCMEYLL
jgi:hypothetical protein